MRTQLRLDQGQLHLKILLGEFFFEFEFFVPLNEPPHDEPHSAVERSNDGHQHHKHRQARKAVVEDPRTYTKSVKQQHRRRTYYPTAKRRNDAKPKEQEDFATMQEAVEQQGVVRIKPQYGGHYRKSAKENLEAKIGEKWLLFQISTNMQTHQYEQQKQQVEEPIPQMQGHNDDFLHNQYDKLAFFGLEPIQCKPHRHQCHKVSRGPEVDVAVLYGRQAGVS